MNKLVIGIDSHDSPYGGCTTHFTVFLIDHFLKNFSQVSLPYPPNLVRLNPFIPWKTRGNAAVSLTLTLNDSVEPSDIINIIIELSNRYSESAGTDKSDPGIILVEDPGEEDEILFKKIYRRALTDVLDQNLVVEKISRNNKENIRFFGKRGIVGAAAAIGFIFGREKVSFELLVYRDHVNYGKNRRVSWSSIEKIERKYLGETFNNYNFKKNVPVAVPRGPDPVLFGLRGKNPCLLLDIYREVEVGEKIAYSMIFVTNQHTDAHSIYRKIGSLRAYQTGYITGLVSEDPEILKGGHVKITVADYSGSIDVFFFSPTKPMSIYASQLKKGDYIRVLGGAVPSTLGNKIIFEAQKFWLLEAAPIVEILNPRCPRCGRRTKSSGRGKGYKCPHCGYRLPSNADKEVVIKRRDMSIGPYTPPPGRINHLVMPPGIVLNNRRKINCDWLSKIVI